MRRVIYIIGGAAVLFGSFLVALWLTQPSDTQRLAAQRITSYSDLPNLAQNIGLQRSEQFKGAIYRINRINEREVNLSGWLADLEGDSHRWTSSCSSMGRWLQRRKQRASAPM